MRRACAERIRHEQEAGVARPDIDPVSIGNGMVSIVLSLLMSVVQVGRSAALTYGPDVAAVFKAALERESCGAAPETRRRGHHRIGRPSLALRASSFAYPPPCGGCSGPGSPTIGRASCWASFF